MTDEEFERLATTFGFAPSKPLREMLDAAVKAEREACAQIIQSYMDSEHIDDPGWNVARDILNDIQGKKE